MLLFWGWIIVASSIWPGATEPWWSYAPLFAAAALTLAGAVARLGGPARQDERWALWLAVTTALLALGGTVWGIAAGDSRNTLYLIPLILSFVLSPVVAVLVLTRRRMERFREAPERVRPPLGVRLSRGWHEAGRAWTVLRENAGLLLLPATSFVVGTAGWMGGYLLSGMWVERTMPRVVLTGFIVRLPLTALAAFMGVAFLAALDRRLDGEHASVKDGLRVAWSRRGPVFRWSLLATGVGTILQALQQVKSEWALAPLLSWLAGLAWGVLAAFALPVLAIEDVGVRDAIRRAGSIVRERWGEGIAGFGNLTIVSTAISIPFGLVLGVAVAIAAPDRDAMFRVYAVGFIVMIALVSVMGTASQVLSLVLYRYATDRSTGPFRSDELDTALIKRRRFRR